MGQNLLVLVRNALFQPIQIKGVPYVLNIDLLKQASDQACDERCEEKYLPRQRTRGLRVQ